MSDLPARADSLAVLIGTSDYRDPGFPPVPAAANSLERMARMLIDPQVGGWPVDRLVTIHDPVDAVALLRQLRRLAESTAGDLLLYFVGHGVLTETGQLCLLIGDSSAEDPDLTGLEWPKISAMLRDSPAAAKVAILDCCFAGRAIESLSGTSDMVADSASVRGAYTLTASDDAAHVVPLAQQADACTTFTEELLALIGRGVPGGPDVLTLQYLFPHLVRGLTERGRPRPNQRGVDTAGQFVIARNSHSVRGAAPRPAGWPDPAGISSSEQFVEALAWIRRTLGMTQAELSAASGGRLSVGRIGRLINAPGLPRRWATVALYLSVCGAPPEELDAWRRTWELLTEQHPMQPRSPVLPSTSTKRVWWRRQAMPRQR